MKKSTIHIICGPTASGKSAAAIKLAQDKNGVIINCDSMQLYNDLPTLTAQPTEEDKAQVPHKLYGTLHPNDTCSAGNWREIVIPVIEETLAGDQTPVICGGTGLYIKALTDGLSPMPDIPEDIRKSTMDTYAELGAEEFYAQLEKRDPVMAARFHVNHKARILRAWEVLEATGKSLAEWQELPRIPPPENWDFKVHKIMPDRETLYNRCNTRFVQMIENGVLEEIKTFKNKIENSTYRPNIPLAKALGYPSLSDHLDNKTTLEEAITISQGETRKYAKRQTTWFRGQL